MKLVFIFIFNLLNPTLPAMFPSQQLLPRFAFSLGSQDIA